MTEPFIRAEHLGYSYQTDENVFVPALRDINLEIREGEFVAILGRNGSGKSTLAKMLNLILTPTRGSLYICGKNMTDESITDDDVFDVREKIGMVFQNPDNQLVATVVEEDVAFGPENLGVPSEEIRRRVDESLALVGMSEYAKHEPHKLSGGQKQRVAIAGILAMQPKCIIFDESTAMLDPVGRSDMMEIIRRLHRERNLTVIMITHYMNEAAHAERIVVLDAGEVQLDGTPAEVFSDPERLQELGLDVPQPVELLWKLNQRGAHFSLEPFLTADCADYLAAQMHLFPERQEEN